MFDGPAIALIRPLFINEDGVFDAEGRLIATVIEVSNPQQLEQLQPSNASVDNVIVDLQDWQVLSCLLTSCWLNHPLACKNDFELSG